ncbi:MAG TPA: PDZ domain-containing protein [Gemmatimonadales bacterium]|jgi:S1-C subfamily serine protease
MRKFTVAALAACLIIPGAALPQGTPRRPGTRVRVQTGPGDVVAYSDNRGRIGVVVDTRANATGDKIGARIEGITPGGPAADAGIKVGDVITSFNGTALGGVAAENDEDSGPGMKLIELAHELDPGDTVKIEYRRGNETRKATLVAEDLGFSGTVVMPRMNMEGMFPRIEGPEGRAFTFAFGSPWGGIEMVKLNPDLGDYFGTREGVLVVRAPEDSTLALKGGDVILSIGGRKPASPEQAMRILRSYDSGESVTMDVLRKQKHVNVTWKVPDENRMYRTYPRMHEEPSWYRVMPKARRDVQARVWKLRAAMSRAI